MPFKRIIFFAGFLFLLVHAGRAQPFVLDTYGYVKDPKFHQLITQKNYQLVGRYDTVSTDPLDIRASVIYNGEWRYIDQYGELLAEEKDEAGDLDFYPDINVGHNIMDYGDEMPPIEAEGIISNTFVDEYETVWVNGKSGTKHKKSGKEGLKVIYDMLTVYGNGLIGLRKDGKHGMAYSDGRVFIVPEYDEAYPLFGRYGYSVFVVKKEGVAGLTDSLGKEIFKPQYQVISTAFSCNNKNLFRVKKDNKWGIINRSGKPVIEIKYDEMLEIGGKLIRVKENNPTTYGLADCEGKMILEGQKSIEYDYYEGLITFKKDTLIGKLNRDGTIFLHQLYTSIGDVSKKYIVVRKGGKYGLLDKNEKFVIEPLYDDLYPDYSRGLVMVLKRVEWPPLSHKEGYLDFEGNVVIKAEYDRLQPINNNLFFFSKEGKHGLMDRKEQPVKYFEYDEVRMIGDFFEVQKNFNEGIIDIEGNILLPVKYDYIKDGYDFYYRGYCRVKLNGQYYLVDRYGNEYEDSNY